MKEKVKRWCNRNGIAHQDLTAYQTRLSKTNVIVCDIFWVNMRYHVIKHPLAEAVQKRGEATREIFNAIFFDV